MITNDRERHSVVQSHIKSKLVLCPTHCLYADGFIVKNSCGIKIVTLLSVRNRHVVEIIVVRRRVEILQRWDFF